MIYSGVTMTFGSALSGVQIVDIQLPKFASGTQETTHQGVSQFRTFAGTGLVDPGEVSIKINYTPTTTDVSTGIIGDTDDLTIVFPAPISVTVTCTDAVCTGFDPENGTLGNFAQATVKFKISAAPAFS